MAQLTSSKDWDDNANDNAESITLFDAEPQNENWHSTLPQSAEYNKPCKESSSKIV